MTSVPSSAKTFLRCMPDTLKAEVQIALMASTDEEGQTTLMYLRTASRLWRYWGPAAASHYFKAVSAADVHNTASSRNTTHLQNDSVMEVSDEERGIAPVRRSAVASVSQLAPALTMPAWHATDNCFQYWPYGAIAPQQLQQAAIALQMAQQSPAVTPPTTVLPSQAHLMGERHPENEECSYTCNDSRAEKRHVAGERKNYHHDNRRK
jgi:hypothetical protein